jgi:hypothetical protein
MEIPLSVIWGTALLAGGYARPVGAVTLQSATMSWLSSTPDIGAVAVALVTGLAAVWPIREIQSLPATNLHVRATRQLKLSNVSQVRTTARDAGPGRAPAGIADDVPAIHR